MKRGTNMGDKTTIQVTRTNLGHLLSLQFVTPSRACWPSPGEARASRRRCRRESGVAWGGAPVPTI